MEGLDAVELTDGKFADGKLSFSLVVPVDGQDISSTISGKLDGDKLVAVTEVEIDGGIQEFDIEAARKTRTKDVAGKWSLEVEAEGQFYEPSIELTESEGKLSGKFMMDEQGEVELKEVILEKNKLTFNLSIPFGDGELDLSFTGMPLGDKIKGEMEFDGEPGTGTGEFSGKREAPKKK